MKYADGPSVEVEAWIDAPPAVVWAFVSDIATPCQFSQELQETRWIDDTHFAGRNHHDAVGEWETTCTVVANEPEWPNRMVRGTLYAASGAVVSTMTSAESTWETVDATATTL